MEADLARYHHIDLVDLYRGELSLRKVHVLVTHLPHDSALVKTLSDAPVFGLTDYLLADLWVLLAKANFQDMPDRHPWLDTPGDAPKGKRERMLARQARYAKTTDSE